MFWLVKVALWIGASWVASRLEQMRQRRNEESPKPAGQDDIQAPTVEEGRAIPVVWGTCLLKSPNVLWYGGLTSERTDAGFKYYLNMMWGWCHGPLDAVVSLLWDELEVPVKTLPPELEPIPYPLLRDAAPPAFWISGYNLFGGDEKEGGVSGRYDFYWGTSDQSPDPFLAGQMDVDEEDFPAYRGLCYSVAKQGVNNQFYQGTSAYMKPHALVARRCPNQLGLTDGRHDIDGDANPACLVYELLTDDRWGIRLPPELIDVVAFRAVGDALAAEGFGLSFQQTDQTDAEEIIQEVCRHVDGLVDKDPATGLITMALIRGDYDPQALTEIDDDSILELEEFARPGPDTLANKVLVKYVDRDQHYEQKIAMALDLAGVQARGAVIPQDVSFLGISNAELAQQVAARELKGVAYPFASVRLRVNRKAWALRPGSPFRFSHAPLGIDGMVCRVVRMSLGPITDGAIRIEAIEDAFGVDWTAYSPPAPSGWVWPLART